MAFTDDNRTTMDRIDSVLRYREPFQSLPITLQGYEAWYALLLGSLTTLVGDDEVVLGHADYDEAADVANLIVFTKSLVIVVDVQAANTQQAETSARAVSRRSIRSLDVQVTDRHDKETWGRRARTWPGALTFTAEYSTLTEPLKFTALSYDPYGREDEGSDATRLLAGLRADLAASTQS
jgi:hypothetical protein